LVAKTISPASFSFCGTIATTDGSAATACVEVLRVPELRDAFAGRVIEPRLHTVEEILRRGAERGEVDPTRISVLVARTGPALVIETFLLTGTPPAADELARIVDTVVMPLVSPAP
jgi:hypothetical protein